MARTKSNIGLNRVLDLIRCGFCIWDREGIVIYSNRCLDKWLNREPPEIIGCHLSEFFIAADHERLQVVLNDLEAGNSRMHIATLRIHNGSTFRVIISPVAVSSHEKQDAGGAAIIVDFGEF